MIIDAVTTVIWRNGSRDVTSYRVVLFACSSSIVKSAAAIRLSSKLLTVKCFFHSRDLAVPTVRSCRNTKRSVKNVDWDRQSVITLRRAAACVYITPDGRRRHMPSRKWHERPAPPGLVMCPAARTVTTFEFRCRWHSRHCCHRVAARMRKA